MSNENLPVGGTLPNGGQDDAGSNGNPTEGNDGNLDGSSDGGNGGEQVGSPTQGNPNPKLLSQRNEARDEASRLKGIVENYQSKYGSLDDQETEIKNPKDYVDAKLAQDKIERIKLAERQTFSQDHPDVDVKEVDSIVNSSNVSYETAYDIMLGQQTREANKPRESVVIDGKVNPGATGALTISESEFANLEQAEFNRVDGLIKSGKMKLV